MATFPTNVLCNYFVKIDFRTIFVRYCLKSNTMGDALSGLIFHWMRSVMTAVWRIKTSYEIL